METGGAGGWISPKVRFGDVRFFVVFLAEKSNIKALRSFAHFFEKKIDFLDGKRKKIDEQKRF